MDWWPIVFIGVVVVVILVYVLLSKEIERWLLRSGD